MSKKYKKPLTEEEKFEMELQQERDLQHQQRDYRVLCKEREIIDRSGDSRLAKQRKVIDIYRHELANLTMDLNVALAPAKVRGDRENSEQLVDQISTYNRYSDGVKVKKTHIREIDQQLTRVKKDIAYIRSIQLTDKMYQDRKLEGQKTLEGLENKLDVQIKKFCTISWHNQILRDTIDHLLKERTDFNLKWDTFIKNLSIGKKFMLDLIEQATIAYDQRDEWCNKLQALRTRAHSDLLTDIDEMRDLQRREDHEKKMQEFFTIKGQKRVMARMEAKERARREEKRLEMEAKMKLYSDTIIDVMTFMKKTDMEDIMIEFNEKETKNFALFKLVNEMNREMQELNEQLANLRLEIDEQNFLMEVRANTQQDKLTALRKECDRALHQAEAAEFNLRVTDANLAQLEEAIHQLFTMCRCSRETITPLLGEIERPNDFNVLIYLRILEKQVLDYICDVYNMERVLLAARKLKARQKMIRTKPRVIPLYTIDEITPSNPCPLCVEHEMVSDVIDVLQRASTREDTEFKLTARLQLPDGLERIHNVSECHLPKSRQIIQKRFQ